MPTPTMCCPRRRARRARPRLPSCLLLAALLLAHPSPSRAQRPGTKFPKWGRLKFFSLYKDAPILRHMLPIPGFNESHRIVEDHVTYIEDQVLGALGDGANSSDPADRKFRPCTAFNDFYPNAVRGIFEMKGQPAVAATCITDVLDTKLFNSRPPHHSMEDVYDAIVQRARVLYAERHHVLDKVLFPWRAGAHLVGDWSKVSTYSDLHWDPPSRRCVYSVVGFIRRGPHWYSSLTLTSAPADYALPKPQRQHLEEYVHIGREPGGALVLDQIMPRYVSDVELGPPVPNTTTLFSMLGGRATQSTFLNINHEDNPAVLLAVDKGGRDVEQVIDALAPSTIAILFLPLLFNLIPITLVSMVSTRVMLTYILLTDVLSVVPLMAKGIELIIIGKRRHHAIATRIISAVNGTRGIAAGAELWGAECRSHANVLPAGIAYLTFALVFMVLGITLEFLLLRYVQKRQGKWNAKKTVFMRVGEDEYYDDMEYRETMQIGSERGSEVWKSRG